MLAIKMSSPSSSSSLSSSSSSSSHSYSPSPTSTSHHNSQSPYLTSEFSSVIFISTLNSSTDTPDYDNHNASETYSYEDNVTSNCQEFCGTLECTIEELRVCVWEYVQPSALEWLFISLHIILFTVGVLGNFLVCFVVLRFEYLYTYIPIQHILTHDH